MLAVVVVAAAPSLSPPAAVLVAAAVVPPSLKPLAAEGVAIPVCFAALEVAVEPRVRPDVAVAAEFVQNLLLI